MAKALVAGAATVMLGGLLAGSEEAPGETFYDEGKKWKLYRGSASLEAQVSRIDLGGLDRVRPTEGVQRRVAYRGEAKPIIEDLIGHLRSSMSYVGAHNLELPILVAPCPALGLTNQKGLPRRQCGVDGS